MLIKYHLLIFFCLISKEFFLTQGHYFLLFFFLEILWILVLYLDMWFILTWFLHMIFCICTSNYPSSLYWKKEKKEVFFAYWVDFAKNQLTINVRNYFWKFCGSGSAKMEEALSVSLSHWSQLKTLKRIHKPTIWYLWKVSNNKKFGKGGKKKKKCDCSFEFPVLPHPPFFISWLGFQGISLLDLICTMDPDRKSS